MRRAFRILAALAVLIGLGWSDTHAQVPMTGAGRGTPAVGTASVTPDVLGTTKYQATSGNFNATPLTITAGLTGPGLACALLRADSTNDVTAGVALTWNGVAMALRKTQSTGTTSAVFLFGLHNPASGAQTLNVSGTNSARDNFVNCVSFSNVNQTSDALAFPNPVGANAVNNISVTSAAGHIAFGVGNPGPPSFTILGTPVINDTVSGGIINAMADYVVSSGASTTVGTTATSVSNIAGMDISN